MKAPTKTTNTFRSMVKFTHLMYHKTRKSSTLFRKMGHTIRDTVIIHSTDVFKFYMLHIHAINFLNQNGNFFLQFGVVVQYGPPLDLPV